MRQRLLLIVLGCSVLARFTLLAQPEAFEIGPHNVDQLPGGKEADGIYQDLVIRNGQVEALIGFNSIRRRASLGTYYAKNGQTPGCLYDLTPRGVPNDQLSVFSPSNQRGNVTSVRIVADGSEGRAIVETRVSAAMNKQLEKIHRYELEEGWRGLLVTTTLTNSGSKSKKVKTRDNWNRFEGGTGSALGVRWAAAVDPADRLGYAVGWVAENGNAAPPAELEVAPGAQVSYSRFIAVAASPAAAIGHVLQRKGATGHVEGTVRDRSGAPVTTGKVVFSIKEKSFPAYFDESGQFSVALPAGSYSLAYTDWGRETITREIQVVNDRTVNASATMTDASQLVFTVTDERGADTPCKVQFHGIGATPNPNLGPETRAHGSVDQYFSETGEFTVAVAPGDYEVRITRGIEFDQVTQIVTLNPGEVVPLGARLRRVVDTEGWVSADFHNHTTVSGDNSCGTDDRIISLAAEHIEFAPSTEHNRIYDWQPHIDRLGLADKVKTVVGLELTGQGTHFNAFPLEAEAHVQDAGAPEWHADPRVNAIVLRDFQKATPDRWVQMNHPDMIANFIDRSGDGLADGGYNGLARMVDGLETQNYRTSSILEGVPYRIVSELKTVKVESIREFVWLQLLNQGHPYRAVAVADAHTIYGRGLGGWRTYIASGTDAPGEIDWKEISRNAKAGRMVLSTGPFLEVSTEDGTIAGGTTRGNGGVKLRVRVQCNNWTDINRVQILVNGRQRSDLNYTRESHPDWFSDETVRFEQEIDVSLSEDCHLIVVAVGEGLNLATGYGTSPQGELEPCAYNNPIYVDVNGDGFRANGDTLGFRLPVKVNVEEARRILGLE